MMLPQLLLARSVLVPLFGPPLFESLACQLAAVCLKPLQLIGDRVGVVVGQARRARIVGGVQLLRVPCPARWRLVAEMRDSPCIEPSINGVGTDRCPAIG